MTVAETTREAIPAASPPPDDDHFTTWTDWDGYVAIADALQRDRRLRITYDRGTLEIMTISEGHEAFKTFLARLVEALTEELRMEVRSRGSMTFRRKDLDRGVEPDECYWIGSAAALRNKREVDIVRDPPPDLIIEVDMSRARVDRMSIHPAMGIPEVWQIRRGGALVMHRLTADGRYEAAETSRSFPGVRPSDLMRFAAMADREGETAAVLAFREWVRSTLRPS